MNLVFYNQNYYSFDGLPEWAKRTLREHKRTPRIRLYSGGARETFAVGHLALGYLSGKGASRLLKAKVNIPLLFMVSIIPDIDLLTPGLEHRGPTHSLVTICLLSIPALTLYGKRTIPYLIAVAQHPLSDHITGGGVQLLWPVISNWYGTRVNMIPPAGVFIEWILFLTSITAMLKAKDARALLQPHPSNLLLSIPVLTVLLPPFFQFPLPVPRELILPHLTFLVLFTLSILRDLEPSQKNTKQRPQNRSKTYPA